ncbi:MAG: hypothetical protein UZ17_ACD001000544 [Acidobacteria bacterium OLB17]|nr:MAG: hypothetical protein UZ17_ACD001000544 [Acidobacteria bacterium OLB17]MCZ2389619.1 hypothetical protein [Acidobacteriota bacterium]
MPTLTMAETKGVCHIAYDGVTGENYRFPDGSIWTILADRATHMTGFKAVLTKPGDRSLYVLAFAGSDSIMDFLHDGVQALGGYSHQYTQALSLTRRYQREYGDLHLSGHSLGGGLAAYSSVATGLSASTINPAPLVGMMSLRSLSGNPQIVNYVPLDGEIVSSSPGRNPGRDIKVHATGNFFTRHMVGNMMPDIPLPTKVGGGASGSW